MAQKHKESFNTYSLLIILFLLSPLLTNKLSYQKSISQVNLLLPVLKEEARKNKVGHIIHVRKII